MRFGRRAMAGCSRASLPRSSCCSRSPPPTVTGWCRSSKPQAARPARPLAISIAFELVIALVILGLVALWRFTPPPRALAADAPISVHVHGEKAMAQIEIERAKRAKPAGERAGARRRVPAARRQGGHARARQPRRRDRAHPHERDARGRERGSGCQTSAATSTWRIDDLRIPVAGRWNLRVEILISDFEKRIIEDTVTLPRVP